VLRVCNIIVRAEHQPGIMVKTLTLAQQIQTQLCVAVATVLGHMYIWHVAEAHTHFTQ